LVSLKNAEKSKIVVVNAEYAIAISPKVPYLSSSSNVEYNHAEYEGAAHGELLKEYTTKYDNSYLMINVSSDAGLRYCDAKLNGIWTRIGEAKGATSRWGGATSWTFLCAKGLTVRAGYSIVYYTGEGDMTVSFSELKVS